MREQPNNYDGMNIPSGYFEQMQEKVLAKANQQEKDGMALPDDYFESLQQNVLTKLPSKQRRRYLVPIGIAASFLLLVSCLWFFSSEDSIDPMITERNIDMINYLMDNSDYYDLEELAELIDFDQTIHDDDILLEYIDEEDFDIDELIDLI